jgi:hypothetical protein
MSISAHRSECQNKGTTTWSIISASSSSAKLRVACCYMRGLSTWISLNCIMFTKKQHDLKYPAFSVLGVLISCSLISFTSYKTYSHCICDWLLTTAFC